MLLGLQLVLCNDCPSCRSLSPKSAPGSSGHAGWIAAPLPYSRCVSRSDDSFSHTPLGGAECLGAHGLFILSGISVLNSSLFQESRGFGASKHSGPMGRAQPVPTSCVSVTAKHTAHQLPKPCSPGKFLWIKRCQTEGTTSVPPLALGSAPCFSTV